ncbi:MAG: hypothetical protein KC684_04115 [Candidatus Omnitrophica bacterium]|nr:hypothetical protein [Candidatus Omnitrophota bacterium]
MSIINDALKKAQEQLKQKDSSANKAQPAPQKEAPTQAQQPASAEPQTPKPISPASSSPGSSGTSIKTEAVSSRKKNYTPIIVFFLIALTALGTVSYFLFGNKLSSKEPAEPKAVMFSDGEIINPNTQKKPPSKPLFGRTEFVLTGTMQMGEKKAAIINNEVYQIGDTIFDMTVVDIRAKEADLMKDGKVTTISVR